MMQLSKEILDSAISEFKEECLRANGSHDEDGCDGCQFMNMLRNEKPLAESFTAYIGEVLLTIDPILAILDTDRLFAVVSGVFLVAMKAGRLQVLNEQQNLEQQVKYESH